MVFVAGVLMLPVLAYGIRGFDKPSAVFGRFQNIGSRKILRAVLGGIAERLEQPGIDQSRNVMHLAVQHPPRLLRREADGQLTEQRQEPMLIFFHYATPVAQTTKTEQPKTIATREREDLGFGEIRWTI
jgi:hypothetical protein